MQKAKKLGWSAIPVSVCVFAWRKIDTSDEVFCVGDGRGPIKTSSESFADQVYGGRVIAIGARVNFKK